MKYYIIAGEASGDLHGSNLIKALIKEDPEAEFRVWGGDKMHAATGNLVKHYKEHAFMGIVPVIKNYSTIRDNFKLAEKDIEEYAPDALILIDFSGFNLRIAKKVKHLGLTVFYYISPQVWAWRQHRVYKIRELVDRMFTILPFEKGFYKKYEYDVEYVGHPLLDSIAEFKKDFTMERKDFLEKNKLSGKPLIAILPGSRKQELQAQLPLMVKVSRNFPDHQFVVAGMSSLNREIYTRSFKDFEVKLILDQTYELLSFAEAALVTSGTATLETALFNIPEVVCYRAGRFSYHLVKALIKIKFISIVNLIMDKQVVKELIQNELTVRNITDELRKLQNNTSYREEMLKNYATLEKKLGGEGASLRAARGMVEFLSQQTRKN